MLTKPQLELATALKEERKLQDEVKAKDKEIQKEEAEHAAKRQELGH